MAVLPQAQWEQMYPMHTISYQEYVRQQTAAEGGQSQPTTQAQSQPSSNIDVNSILSKATANGTRPPDQSILSNYLNNESVSSADKHTISSAIQNYKSQWNQKFSTNYVDQWKSGKMTYAQMKEIEGQLQAYSDASGTDMMSGYRAIQQQAQGTPMTLEQQRQLQLDEASKIFQLTETQKQNYLKTGNPVNLKPTLTDYYNQQRAANPNLSFDQIKTQWNNLGGAQTGTVTYNTPTMITNQQGGDPTNSGSSNSGSWMSDDGSGNVSGGGPLYTPPVSGTSTNNDAALQVLINSPAYQGLPADQQTLLRMVVQNWNPNSEINMSNVLAEFDRIKSSTIDPYFAEQVSTFQKNVRNQYQSIQEARTQELQAEGITNENNMRATRGNLESSGMSFSGEGQKQLGSQGAGEGYTGEGLVQQASRLMASSTSLDFQNRLRNLGLGAEQALGASGMEGIIPGYQNLGISTGSIAQSKTEKLGQTLSTLGGQQANMNSYKAPVDFSQFNNVYK